MFVWHEDSNCCSVYNKPMALRNFCRGWNQWACFCSKIYFVAPSHLVSTRGVSKKLMNSRKESRATYKQITHTNLLRNFPYNQVLQQSNLTHTSKRAREAAAGGGACRWRGGGVVWGGEGAVGRWAGRGGVEGDAGGGGIVQWIAIPCNSSSKSLCHLIVKYLTNSA